MKKIILNPEYENATFKITVVPQSGYEGHAFNTLPTLEVQKDDLLMADFLRRNGIPKYISVEE